MVADRRSRAKPGTPRRTHAGGCRAGTAYRLRRKFRTSCFFRSPSWLKLLMTPFASDGPNFRFPRLLCSWIATSRSSVRPSWRKKMRLPRPHSGEVREEVDALVVQRLDRDVGTRRQRWRVTERASDTDEQRAAVADRSGATRR